MKVIEYQIDWPRDGNTDEGQSKLGNRRDLWYTGPDPYKGMEVKIISGSSKAFSGTVRDSRVDSGGKWWVNVQCPSMVSSHLINLGLSDVVELLYVDRLIHSIILTT